MRARSGLLALLAGLMGSSVATAAEPTARAAAPSATPAAVDVAPSGIRRDPKGVQGISPFWEAIGKGDAAVLARDYEAALAAYRDAISKSPQHPSPHIRIAEVQKLKGDLKEAEVAYNAALRFTGNDATLKGKMLFCLAELSERQKEFEAATERWTAYEAFAKTAEKATLYPASAAERKKRIQEWKQLAADASQVKARIEKRAKEGDEATRRNAGGK